jgi:hypothetical protein
VQLLLYPVFVQHVVSLSKLSVYLLNVENSSFATVSSSIKSVLVGVKARPLDIEKYEQRKRTPEIDINISPPKAYKKSRSVNIPRGIYCEKPSYRTSDQWIRNRTQLRILLVSSVNFRINPKNSFFLQFFAYYLLKLHLHHFSKIRKLKKVIKKSQKRRNQSFSYYFCWR